MTDQELFEMIKLGDRKALGEVYKANRDPVINWITNKHSCSLEEAKDIYQDAIMIFFNNAVKNKISEINFSISSYLHEVVRRQFLNKLKKDNKVSRGLLDFIGVPAELNVEPDYYEQKLELVHRAMQELSATCQKLIQMKYFTNLSMESIGEQMGYKNPSTTKNLKYKCMRILRRKVNTMSKQGYKQRSYEK